MRAPSDVTTERILMGLLMAGLAVGCWLVLAPFLSAILWAGILVFTTWPVYRWTARRLHLGDNAAAAVMVGLTALLIVLPLAVVAPAGADDVQLLRGAVEDAVARGLPGAPAWLMEVPVIGATVSEYWNTWAADLSAIGDTLRPYLGAIVENGLKLMLSIAGGLLQFLLALVVAYFFYASGDTLAATLSRVIGRIAGRAGAPDHRGHRRHDPRHRLRHSRHRDRAGLPHRVRPVAIRRPAGVAARRDRRVHLGLAGRRPVVWIPAALWLLSSGHTGWGIFLATYGLLIISGSDNVIRPYFIARGAKLPFLLTILGVLGGALAFGLLGIFLGRSCSASPSCSSPSFPTRHSRAVGLSPGRPHAGFGLDSLNFLSFTYCTCSP